MSILRSEEPSCTNRNDLVEMLIEGRSKDLGGFSVRRVLPAPRRKTVGPFIFFDEMGPADFPAGKGINVRPHPHIGLSTVTFLFEGEILHRDSLGFVQQIQPGAVNLMTAGRGIVHSERTPEEFESTGQRLHGIQTWMSLPNHKQEIDPAFVHYPKCKLPVISVEGSKTTVIIGEAQGVQSPVTTYANTLYLEQRLEAGAVSVLPDTVEERAVYVVSGEVALGDCLLTPGAMGVSRPGVANVVARRNSRIMIIGGEPIGRRIIWWNFVQSSQARIDQAKQDWKNGDFDPVPGEDEFIPLPVD